MKTIYKTISVIVILAILSAFETSFQDPKQYTIEQFYKTIRYNGGSFSFDEKNLLIGSNQTGIYNVFEISVNGGEAQALTNSTTESLFPISYFPSDNRMLYASDQGGNEIDHIYLKNEKGEVTDLTPDKGAISSFLEWSKDKKSFFYTSNKRDKRFFDLYEMDISKFQSKMIYQNDGGYQVSIISGNKNIVSLLKPITTSVSELYLYKIDTKETIKISVDGADYAACDFSLDNQSFYYLTDYGSEFKHLMRYDIPTQKSEKIWEEKWDISYAYHTEKGKYRVVGINEDAKNVVKIFDTKTGKQIEVPKIPDGDILGVIFSPSESKMSLRVGSSKSPANIYSYDLNTKKLQKLTNSLNPEINEEDLVSAEVVRYKSFDGVEIPAILYKPKQANANKKVPALVWVHGGPGGQSRVGFSEEMQYYVNHGYAILAVNNRGSSGYGKTFYRMDDKNHGEGDLQDCIEGKNYLATLPYIDANKIGIMGGSYGGFMVMAALTSQPKEFKVGVDYFGVVNWMRTLESIPSWWEAQRIALYEEMGDPTTSDSIRLRKISPLFHADKIEKPVLFLQGAQDPRVLQIETDEMAAAAKNKGVPVEYVLFPDEGHGFVKKENQINACKAVLAFLDKYLR
ncbi:S9 family peptidase [Moheibacter sediminis]|uniref:Dipeptidyl aminopeptidase/acylaminoacyl peptidase n=1 Tax=Moheibacter sediminis TaxID=1434700 RepID=A0A1W2CPV7_9FLAO|nr:S9 family peptidase [Moheibacter sediminis]SMC87026.1 Dipeptidyl aminopeptidase/acylaminoacyl peptidase [Moheibacter sediminis]